MQNPKYYSWFSSAYTSAQRRQLVSALQHYTQLETQDTHTNAILQQSLVTMLEVLLDEYEPLSSEPLPPLADSVAAMTPEHAQDYLALALVLCLLLKTGYRQRVALLLENWSDQLQVVATMPVVLRAIRDNNVDIIKDDTYLGEGFQNKIARENGKRWLGQDEYLRQMRVMQDGEPHNELQQKYEMLNELPVTTLGGALCHMLRQSKLSLPGEPYGFAEFFLWHDLTHLLSGNGTDYPGELGANIFAAACSQRSKYEILVWGLLQFNLGSSLAVVASPGLDNMRHKRVLQQYCLSLLAGSGCTLDVLSWPLEQMFQDLRLPLDEVRAKYHIKAIMPADPNGESSP